MGPMVVVPQQPSWTIQSYNIHICYVNVLDIVDKHVFSTSELDYISSMWPQQL